MKNLELKKHAMTAISYMLPLVVAAGLLIAIGNLTNGSVIENFSDGYSVSDAIVSMGVLGMQLLPAVIAAGIAYSIADRPGIAPGLIIGMIAFTIGAGFFGGMLGGYVVGYFTKWMKNNIKVPGWAESLLPMMILPLLASLIVGLLMYFVIGVPIVWITEVLTTMLNNLSDGSNAIFGTILGAMVAFDYGGPINKTASLFSDGLLLEGVMGPEAVKVACSMVPPLGISIAYFVRKSIFSKQEQENVKIAFPLGLCMITEGVIPIAAKSPVKVISATTVGAAVCGAIIMVMGVESPVPAGGIFVIPAMNKPIWFTLALLAGSIVTALILLLIKKPADDEVELEEEKINLDDLKMEEL